MKNKSLAKPLCGIVPPLVTPLFGRDKFDVAGFERLLEHVIGGGVHGVFILGTTGEAPSLSYRLRREVIEQTCKIVRGRVPVLVGITDTSIVEAINLARYAAESGAQALVTSAPYYFPAGQPELIDWAQQLVPQLPLPLYIYNMPQMTKVTFEPETIQQLTQLEGIAGLKDSSGDLNYYKKLVHVAKARPDWRVFVGPEHLLVDTLRLGGHGGVNGGGQVDPTLLVGLYEATLRGDNATVERLQARLTKLGEIYRVGKHASTVIKGVKCALNLMGICAGELAEPLRSFKEPQRLIVEQCLTDLGLLPNRSAAQPAATMA
ncbi:MAG: dihydrodipicolinate synthase family protein [Verrucomicrobia bacterium]|nr:dihydrodipicolinate synthase family protein [Verrucomicrobiota bacterium]